MLTYMSERKDWSFTFPLQKESTLSIWEAEPLDYEEQLNPQSLALLDIQTTPKKFLRKHAERVLELLILCFMLSPVFTTDDQNAAHIFDRYRYNHAPSATTIFWVTKQKQELALFLGKAALNWTFRLPSQWNKPIPWLRDIRTTF